MEQRFCQRKRDYKCLAIWSCTAKAKGAYDYPCDGCTGSKPYRGRTAAGLYVGTNQLMLAVNRLRLKVQRKLLMICAGLKQACLRNRVAKYLNAFETALGSSGEKGLERAVDGFSG